MGSCVVVLIGVLLQATAFQLPQLIVARIVTGLGVGSITATIPTWVGESAEAHNRGWLVMLEGSGAIFGMFYSREGEKSYADILLRGHVCWLA